MGGIEARGREPFEPMMSPERSERLRAWHDDASAQLHRLGRHRTTGSASVWSSTGACVIPTPCSTARVTT
jgi:hypothetical protein